MFQLSETVKEEFDNQLNQLRRFTTHGPSLGRFIEVMLLRLLKKYLPASLDFTSGFIQGMDPEEGTCSPQLDIICYDRINYPVIFDLGEIKVVPARAVKGIIEVKSTLTKSRLKDMLELSTSESMKEVPLTSKFYIVALKSKVTPKSAFKLITEFYSNRPSINKFFSAIFDLEWKEMIVFSAKENDNKIEYEMGRILIGDYGLSVFLGTLMVNLYGNNAVNSIANVLAPSLYKGLEYKSFTLYLGKTESI